MGKVNILVGLFVLVKVMFFNGLFINKVILFNVFNIVLVFMKVSFFFLKYLFYFSMIERKLLVFFKEYVVVVGVVFFYIMYDFYRFFFVLIFVFVVFEWFE